MTRVLVIGSSHTGSIIRTREEIAGQYPEIELNFFAMPGAKFHQFRRLSGSQFGLGPEADAEALKTCTKINGTTSVNLTQYDSVLIIGYRFHVGIIMRLLAHNDVLEYETMNHPNAVSLNFLERSCEALMNGFSASLDEILGCDTPLVLSPAPAPSEDLLKRGASFDGALSGAHANPAFPSALAYHHTLIEKWATERGHSIVHQPSVTLAKTYATRQIYTNDARNFADHEQVLTDGRHMNADYGLLLFEKFATEILGL
ncbi:MAG: hypothetical protein ACI875_001780 [Planctomycetota bacterium]|jgi:hypothetical protein